MSYQGRLGAITALCLGLVTNSEVQASSISADGRYVAFYSLASNLVAGDHNSSYDVFVRDVQTGVTSRVSLSSTGMEGNGASRFPSISADGRYVAFQSDASNLVAGDTNGAVDVFVRDTQSGITTRVSLDSAGNEGNLGGASPSISAGGRYVAFDSYASNLVTGDTNGTVDVFVRDTHAGVTTRVNIDSAGVESKAGGFNSSISADGRYVVFTSVANDLVAGDSNNTDDVFLRDTQTDITTRISLDSSGVEGNNLSFNDSISADGRYVTFQSYASNLVAGDVNGTWDIFIHDTQAGVTNLISRSSVGVGGNHDSFSSNASSNGHYVTFESNATNLVAGDGNGAGDVFIHDTQTGATTRISLDPAGNQSTLGEVVEFFNTNLLHYFITSSETEASAIDNGSAGTGWTRTGKTFKAGGRNVVCRFYGSQSPGPNSHFYTADINECNSLIQIQDSTPDTQKRWNYEGLSFAVSVPVNGICTAGSEPVYRAYNNGFSLGIDSNHRITTDIGAIQEVVNLGWKNEGVVMCAPI